jgi:hypothetical protein
MELSLIQISQNIEILNQRKGFLETGVINGYFTLFKSGEKVIRIRFAWSYKIDGGVIIPNDQYS